MNVPSLYYLDHDQDDLFFFKDAATGLPLQVKTFSYHSDFELALRNSHLPDLIFLDINMPGKNGFEILAWLKSNEDFSAIPVVMF